MSNPVTLQDIANMVGVGKATVSLALRDDPRLREETRRRIQKAAADMGYRANAVMANLMAQLRARKAPKFQATLGLVKVSDIKGAIEEIHSFHEWADGCRYRAEQMGYGFDEFWLNDPEITPSRYLKILQSRNIRGLIVVANLTHGRLPMVFSELWKRFASVVIGIQITHPPMHFASNDQFATAYRSTQEVLRRGYAKPAFVNDPEVDELLDFRYSAGYWSATNHLPQERRIPVFEYSADGYKNFASWFQKHKPDAIITQCEQIRDWLDDMKVNIPGSVGLAHMDYNSRLNHLDWAGMKQNNELVGTAAVDMLVGQMHRNEFGTPSYPKCMLVESTWVEGPTLPNKEVQTPVPHKQFSIIHPE